jgi:hypothetical protein
MRDGSNAAGGQASQAIGRTKGGLNTRIHALVNARSQAVVIALPGGNQADISLVEKLTECLPEDSTLIGDEAFWQSLRRIIWIGSTIALESSMGEPHFVPERYCLNEPIYG